MKEKLSYVSPLARVEMEALEAGQEWTRRKIERDLQKLADNHGDLSPLDQTTADSDPSAPDPFDDECRSS